MSIFEKEFIRLPDLVESLGLCKASIYNLMSNSDFPRPVKLTPSGRAVAWRQADVRAWIESRDYVDRS